MTRNQKSKPITLNLAQQEKFKEQILIILADYRVKDSLQSEAAERVMNNLRIVATMKTVRGDE